MRLISICSEARGRSCRDGSDDDASEIGESPAASAWSRPYCEAVYSRPGEVQERLSRLRLALLPAEASQNVGIGDEAEPDRYVAGRATALHERLGFVAARAARGALDGAEIEAGKLYIARSNVSVATDLLGPV
jgi:hypothetical protein